MNRAKVESEVESENEREIARFDHKENNNLAFKIVLYQ